MNVDHLLGYNLVVGDKCEVVSLVKNIIEEGGPAKWLACLNPHSYVESKKNYLFHTALHAADILVPDGIGLVLASCFLGGRLRRRVTGSDIFYGVNHVLDQRGGYKVFFLGSTDECLEDIKAKFLVDYPSILIVGTWSPPFKETWTVVEMDQMRDAINKVKPDVLWVAMTAPKQEIWINHIRPYLDVRFIGAVGAVFDFYTGRVRRSSVFFQRLGLEWLPRLVQQPLRLGRRLLISAPLFVFDVIIWRLKSKITSDGINSVFWRLVYWNRKR